MTDQEKVSEVLTYLTDNHLSYDGGYPKAYTWVGRTLVVGGAGGFEKGNSIDTYRRSDLIKWYDRAVRWSENENDHPTFEDFSNAYPRSRRYR
jgi:hypothetical protein